MRQKPAELISIIPARGGSKGIPRKNIIPLNGIPLIAYTIRASVESRYIHRTIVSTDDKHIVDISRSYGAEIIKRPGKIAQDDTPTEAVIKHALEYLVKKEKYAPAHVILLQPTSPLRTVNDIDLSYEQFLSGTGDSLLSVCKSHSFIWKKTNTFGVPINYDYRSRPRRQDLYQYRENGAIYIFKRELFLTNNNRLRGRILLYEMEEDRSIEIDNPFDILIAETILKTSPETQSNMSLNRELRKLIQGLKMLITDVDGVLTDGGMYYDHKGEIMKKFNTKDGMGLEQVAEKGIKVAIITREKSQIAVQRAKKLKIENVFTGIPDKLSVVKNLARKHDINLHEIGYIGDDLNDLEVLRNVGLPFAVQNASREVKSVAKYITRMEGGKGAVREVCDLITSLMASNQ
jgi:N-acylneuraminate cytidylyltransferase